MPNYMILTVDELIEFPINWSFDHMMRTAGGSDKSRLFRDTRTQAPVFKLLFTMLHCPSSLLD